MPVNSSIHDSTHDSIHDPKQALAQRFGQAAAVYNAQAQMQKCCARQLINALPDDLELPSGDILEIGCGTGFVTQQLIQRFPDRTLQITDLSAEMLQFCQAHLQIPAQQQISFQQMDGEAIALSQPCAMIVSGFAIQWFQNPIQSLLNLFHQIQPCGYLLLSFPTDRSFPEWKQVCHSLHLPFTANLLPNAEAVMLAFQSEAKHCRKHEESVCLTFAGAADFFRSLKSIGAGLNQSGQQLSLTEMRQLIQHWDRQAGNSVTVHFQVCFLIIQR